MKNCESVDRIIQVNDIDIGKNIARIRKSMNIKQTDMVARLQINGIDHFYLLIQPYRKRHAKIPTVSFLFACCHILECDMNTILISKQSCSIMA